MARRTYNALVLLDVQVDDDGGVEVEGYIGNLASRIHTHPDDLYEEELVEKDREAVSRMMVESPGYHGIGVIYDPKEEA